MILPPVLEKGTDPGRVADSSEILERLEKDLQIARHDFQKVSVSVGPLCSIDSLFCLPTSFGSRRISS
jgi:hypothetical protein